METVMGVVGVLIIIIIGMIFGRAVQFVGLILTAVIKFLKKLFWTLWNTSYVVIFYKMQ